MGCAKPHAAHWRDLRSRPAALLLAALGLAACGEKADPGPSRRTAHDCLTDPGCRQVMVVAHRGHNADHPENSLAAIRAAAELGCDYSEVNSGGNIMADHVCPVWVGYLMANPLRKLFQNPNKILADHVQPGMRVLDVGCAMGFFSVPMAERVGPDGQVVCVDVQENMLTSLKKRARRAGVRDRIHVRRCTAAGLGCEDLDEQIDFALAFAMVHEVDDPAGFLEEVYACLGQGGRLLIAEPRGRVTPDAFEETIRQAESAGFAVAQRPRIRSSHAVLLLRARA
jgi:2-polyprenyl-3-methyl-5-hydroxy-6-metoxy-1,4-benzoquinol methylase